jgi:two-component system nitrogen regulation sensor histidine kinase NtrY
MAASVDDSLDTALPSTPLGQALGGPLRYAFGIGFILAAAVTAITIFLTATAPGSRTAAGPSGVTLVVLSLNLLLILALTAGVGWRALQIFGRRAPDAGVRLHRRFVAMFSLAAMLPAIVVALFFGLLVTQGVDNWFSSRVRTVVENAAKTSKAYVEEQFGFIEGRMTPMVTDLNRPEVGEVFAKDRLNYSALLAQAVEHDFTAVYVIDAEGRVMARAEAPGAPPYIAPPTSAFTAASAAASGHRETTPTQVDVGADVVRVLYRLSSYPNAYLYVVRSIKPGMLGQLRGSEAAVVTYRDAEQSRRRVQLVFALSYLSTALLVLIGAVWVGLGAATQIATPVARLVQAADRVASGDLSARVPIDHDPEEIAVLSRAFNRMTGDLKSQQEALRAASLEAQARSRFIETVLSGVSAGVIGLDERGAVSAANDRATALLGFDRDAIHGRPIGIAAPELAGCAHKAMATGSDVEAEVDVVRGAETRRLRVRASGLVGGVVLTFDDITRLVAAQRNAAWRDVARRIAHEIKNPLTPIQLSAERLKRKYRGEITGDLEIFDRCTDTIIRQVGDIGRMVDEFSSFARMPAPKFAEEDAAEMLREAVFAQRVAYPDVPVELEEPASLENGGVVPLVCDARMVGQALANVLKNAGEAEMARRAAEPEHHGGLRARLTVDDQRIVFEVEDSGVGLPERDRERLTEPYVTTREKGTGLGLAIVKRILEEHGGELQLTDARNLPGARAVFIFPRRGFDVPAAVSL